MTQMDHQNKSIISNPKGVCEKLFTVFRATSPFRIIRLNSHQHRGDAAKSSSSSPQVSLVTPPWLTNRSARATKQQCGPPTAHSSDLKPRPKPINGPAHNTAGQKKPTVVPIHGQENKVPRLVEHGHVVPASSANINGMFTEFIDRTKQRFHTIPSNVGISKTGGSKDSKIQ